MNTLLVSDFKTRCLAIIEQVHSGGETVLLTRRGKPIVRVMPATEPAPAPRTLGGMAGEASAKGDLVHTSFESDWEAAK